MEPDTQKFKVGLVEYDIPSFPDFTNAELLVVTVPDAELLAAGYIDPTLNKVKGVYPDMLLGRLYIP
jgi:hypothetical protein